MEGSHYKIWSSICICQLFRSMESALECGFSIQCHSIEENWFSLSDYHLEKASWLGMGPCDHFSFSMLAFCLTKACTGLAHAVTVSVSSYAHQLYGVCKNAVFLRLSTTSDPYNFSVLSFQWSLSLEGRGLIKTSHSWMSTPKALNSAHWPVWGHCDNCYLLQGEIYLMRVE